MPTPDPDEPQWIPLAELEAELAPPPAAEPRGKRPSRAAGNDTPRRPGRRSGARGPAIGALGLVVLAVGLTAVGSSGSSGSSAKAADPQLTIQGPTADQQRAALAKAKADQEAAAERKAEQARAAKAK